MKPLHQHDCDCCHYLGTVDDTDLYHCGQSGYGSTLIARYSSDGPDYLSGLCFSQSGILRIAANRAIEQGHLSVEDWRRAAYINGYIPYSDVKRLMQMSDDELRETFYSTIRQLGDKRSRILGDTAYRIMERRKL